MEVRKIRYDGEAVEVGFVQKPKDRATVVGVLTSPDRPSPGFRKALESIVEPAAKFLGFDKKYRDGIAFRSLSINATGGFVVTMLKELSESNSPFVVHTPNISARETTDEGVTVGAPQELQDAVDKIVSWAEKFLAGGAREQGDLIADGEATA